MSPGSGRERFLHSYWTFHDLVVAILVNIFGLSPLTDAFNQTEQYGIHHKQPTRRHETAKG
ncbi:uncharacterized protein BDW47DRAFT_101882, partial [Aspergillus candidus]